MALPKNFAELGSPLEPLQLWMSDKPFEWAPAIATRAAFRVLPWSIGTASDEWVERFTLPCLHSLFIAWSTFNKPIKGHKLSAELSANLLNPGALFHEREAFFASGMLSLSLATAAKKKSDKVDRSIRAINAFNNLIRDKQNAISTNYFWSSIYNDTLLIGKNNHEPRNVDIRKIIRVPLFSDIYQQLWRNELQSSLDKLISINPTFSVWRDWLLRVASGDPLNFVEKFFDDAGTIDRQISTSIVQNFDSGYWQRDPTLVNQDIDLLIEAAKSGELEEIPQTAPVPPQNENAISFKSNAEGKIELTDVTHLDAVRTDQDTLDRYQECMDATRDLLRKCEGSNAAGRLVNMLENYIQASGDSVETIRPSLFVQRGERLRQEILAHQNHDSMLPPLADDVLLDLRGWQAAHNILVGLDPALMARDIALQGPDTRVANVAPDEIRDIAKDAEESGLLAENVVNVVIEATELAPTKPDPVNRRTIWSFETGRNLIIEAFNVALRHPGKAATGAIVSGITVSTLGAGGTIISITAGAIPAARFLMRHRDWIENRLGDSPTWRALFISLCDWIEHETPLKND